MDPIFGIWGRIYPGGVVRANLVKVLPSGLNLVGGIDSRLTVFRINKLTHFLESEAKFTLGDQVKADIV